MRPPEGVQPLPGIRHDSRSAGLGVGSEARFNANRDLTDDGHRETMEVHERDEDRLLEGAQERAGSYDIEITASGYRPWKKTGAEVRPDDSGCHVAEGRLDAGMVRLGTCSLCRRKDARAPILPAPLLPRLMVPHLFRNQPNW